MSASVNPVHSGASSPQVTRNNGLVVVKFGGTSVSTPERIRNVARIISGYRKIKSQILVVVSAMGHTTDELIELAQKVSPYALSLKNRREMDMLLSVGERISMSLLSMALSDVGVEATSFTGSQSGIITDSVHGEARISEIRPQRITEALAQGKVVIVAGFQGVSGAKEITTLGRGGSDTTAVALAVALNASEAVIYTDVDGIHTSDPSKHAQARHISHLPWDVALEAAQKGSQVLHPRCIELAWKHEMPIRVLSSFKTDSSGTVVKGVSAMMNHTINSKSTNGPQLESPKIFVLSHMKDLSLVEKRGLDALEVARLHQDLSAAGLRLSLWQHAMSTVSFAFDSSLVGILEKYLVPDSRREKLELFSVVGIGLIHAPEIYTTVLGIFKKYHMEIMKSQLSTHSISVLYRESALTGNLLKELHDELKV